mmetsp:Transcript_22306/g.51333  ORF Transcript_22306/g.51333 Transcript_22306/m.51333 type:complete len:313 (+) Transcript_22306:1425-2363(+)
MPWHERRRPVRLRERVDRVVRPVVPQAAVAAVVPAVFHGQAPEGHEWISMRLELPAVPEGRYLCRWQRRLGPRSAPHVVRHLAGPARGDAATTPLARTRRPVLSVLPLLVRQLHHHRLEHRLNVRVAHRIPPARVLAVRDAATAQLIRDAKLVHEVLSRRLAAPLPKVGEVWRWRCAQVLGALLLHGLLGLGSEGFRVDGEVARERVAEHERAERRGRAAVGAGGPPLLAQRVRHLNLLVERRRAAIVNLRALPKGAVAPCRRGRLHRLLMRVRRFQRFRHTRVNRSAVRLRRFRRFRQPRVSESAAHRFLV